MDRICLFCAATFHVIKPSDPKKFCSSSCAAKLNNKGRIRTEESKAATSEKLKRLIHEGKISLPPRRWANHFRIGHQWIATRRRRTHQHETRLTKNRTFQCSMCQRVSTMGYSKTRRVCSPECMSLYMRQVVKNNRAKYAGPHVRSWMERSFSEWLKENFKGRWLGRNGWIDFVFPRLKLAVELDGNHHRARISQDKIRDEYLSRNRGYEVIRITHQEYRQKSRLPEIMSRLGLALPEELESPTLRVET